MKFIKQFFLFFTITFLFLVCASLLYYKWFAIEVNKIDVQKEIIAIDKSLKELVLFDYKLTKDNVVVSKHNLKAKEEFYSEFKKKLVDKYKISLPSINVRRSRPVDVKRNLIVWVKNKIAFLIKNGVTVNGNLSLDQYVNKEAIPPLISEIELLYKHFEIINFIVNVISDAEISALVRFERSNGLEFKKEANWHSNRYILELKGTVASLKRVLNSLSNNSTFFIVIKFQNLFSDITITKKNVTDQADKIIKDVTLEELVTPFKLNNMNLYLEFDVYEFGDY